jgi:hypothetical protein
VVGNVFVFANIGMDALAKLGPGKLHQIKLDGKYSTDPEVARSFTVSGTITISAFAGLRMRAEGGAGVEILSHDIKVGVGLDALAGVRGYVEATPSIGMREVGDPTARKTEFFIKGHLELAAQPFLGLSGDLFVELDSPWWSPAPDKKWTWPIGSLEYPLPGEFGIGADLDYVLGSPNLPEIKFGRPAFDSSKFITDLVNDHVPPKRTGEQEKPGTWKEGAEGQGEAPSGPPGAESAPAPGAPTAPTGLGGKDESGQPAPKTAAPGGEGVPGPAVPAQIEGGLEALGTLSERSNEDPLTTAEITSELSLIRKRYGFKHLDAKEVGEEWEVEGEINPKVKKRAKKESAQRRVHETTGVPFEDGFPVFESLFDFRMPDELIGPDVSDETQMRAATRALREWLEDHPRLKRRFSADQLAAITSGKARIPGRTWHHHEDGETLQLVDRAAHRGTGHRGGRAETGGRPH